MRINKEILDELYALSDAKADGDEQAFEIALHKLIAKADMARICGKNADHCEIDVVRETKTARLGSASIRYDERIRVQYIVRSSVGVVVQHTLYSYPREDAADTFNAENRERSMRVLNTDIQNHLDRN
jgi:hypothetical protein